MPRQKRSGRKYPRRKLWIERRDAAFARAGQHCEVTGDFLRAVDQKWHRACHHVLAERWVRRFIAGADPHILENLVVITPSLHAQLTGAENLLFNRTNWIGYRQRMNQLGFPLEILDRAFKALCASVK